MNKKIKIIDLFVKIANGEEVPKKISYKGEAFIFNPNYRSIDNLYGFLQSNGIGWLQHTNIHLTDYVEILDEPEEIEELNLHYVVCQEDFQTMKIVDILNRFFKANNEHLEKIARVVNQMRKERE